MDPLTLAALKKADAAIPATEKGAAGGVATLSIARPGFGSAFSTPEVAGRFLGLPLLAPKGAVKSLETFDRANATYTDEPMGLGLGAWDSLVVTGGCASGVGISGVTPRLHTEPSVNRAHILAFTLGTNNARAASIFLAWVDDENYIEVSVSGSNPVAGSGLPDYLDSGGNDVLRVHQVAGGVRTTLQGTILTTSLTRAYSGVLQVRAILIGSTWNVLAGVANQEPGRVQLASGSDGHTIMTNATRAGFGIGRGFVTGYAVLGSVG